MTQPRRNPPPRRRPRLDAPASEGIELDARRAQRVRTVEVLGRGRTPLDVIVVAEHAATVAEQAIQSAVARQPPRPPLACQPGCDWCCHQMVGTSAPEVFRIVAFLRQHVSAELQRATQERVVAVDEQRRSLRGDSAAARRLACPLLVDHRCSVYPVRPLTCRGFNSGNARRCEEWVTTRQPVEIPAYLPQRRLATFVLDGLRAGLAESGLPHDLLELTAALRVALLVPDAGKRWLAGQPVFGAARFPVW
jgi:Fe-S-cluster containining protein